MLKMYVKFQNLMKREEGQGLVEYGLIVGLIVVAAVAAFAVLSPSIQTLFDNVKASLDAAN